jgi:3'(2'), 5'-bisphosphate nucleotidase
VHHSIAELLEIAKEAAYIAGQEVLNIYDKGIFEEYEKEDQSPVTSADYRANDIIMTMLKEQTPDIH